jgi:PAS domain S-box-containing protein
MSTRGDRESLGDAGAERFADAAVSVALPELRVVHATDGTAAFFGCAEPEPTWQAILARVDPADREVLVATIRGEATLASVEVAFRRSGATRVAHARIAKVRDEAGNLVGADVLFFDVTSLDAARAEDRAHARRANVLARVAERINADLELAALGTELCSEVVRALPLSSAALRVYDPATDAFVAIASVGASAVAERPFPRALVERFVARLGRAAFVRDLLLAELGEEERALLRGSDLRSLVYATVLRGERLLGIVTGGSFGHVVDVTRDDVELLRAIADHSAIALTNAQVLAESRATATRYRTIVETAAEGIVIIDPALEIRFANPQLARMLGREVREVEGTNVLSHVFAEDAEFPPQLLRERLGGRAGPVRWRLRGADDRPIDVVTNAAPILESGRLVALVVVVTDVTASRRLEERLQNAQKLESLGLLAGGIAHDFNNLLASIMGNAGLARVRLDAASPATPHVDDIERAAQRAADLTRQLLSYTGKGRVDVAPVDLGQLVAEMGQLLSTVVGKGIEVRYQLATDLPPVEGDATQLRQIVMNLITNASDAIGDRAGVIRIGTHATRAEQARLSETYVDDGLAAGEYVVLEVRDDGGGMSKETRDRIFDPFFTTKVSGRGLGLAATLGILRAHRGTIEVESTEDAGSTFRVLLPASQAWLRKAQGPESRPRPVTPPGGVVLVVDDEPRVRQVIAAALEIAGYEVLGAADGLEAIEVLGRNRERVRLVILDLTMPRMGGAEAFVELRKIAPKVPIIVGSGYGEQSSLMRFAGGELAGFLEKPFTLDALYASVAEALGEPRT